MWGAITDRVLRRPLVSVVLAGGLLLALAAPALQLTTVQPGIDTFPQHLLTTYNRMQQSFPGTQIAADVVVKADDVQTPEVQAAITQLTDEALATDVMSQPVEVSISPDQTVAVVSIPVAGDGSNGPSNAALDALRDDIVPTTVGALPGAEVAVTGMTAQTRDFDERMASVTPLVFGFVLVLAFLLMLATFRSVVIALKSVLLNLLSVGAAYGVLVLVFQEGWGRSILGFEVTGGIDPFLPVLLFVILFGLSMDYHVLILSRIREAYDGGMTTEEAVAHGIRSTAGRRHQRRDRHGGRLLHLRRPAGDDLQAVRGRARCRDPDRRDADPCRPAAGDDESARPLELVPAPLAGVAAPPRARALPGAGPGRSPPSPGAGWSRSVERRRPADGGEMSTLADSQDHGRHRLWHLPTPARRALLVGPPLVFAGFTILHPQPDENTRALVDASTWFMAYHMIQLPLIGLVAISVLLLADAFGRASAWPVCLGMGTFLVFFSAYDTLAGIGTGLAMRGTRGLGDSQQDIVFDLVRTWPAAEPWVFWLSVVGTGGWVLALGYLTVAARAAGAPRALWILLGLAAFFLLLGHPAPFGTLAFGSLFIATVIHEQHGVRPQPDGRHRPEGEAAGRSPVDPFRDPGRSRCSVAGVPGGAWS